MSDEMKVYEIFLAELGTYVKIKVLDPAEIENFVRENSNLSHEDYCKKVLERVVWNMRSEILESLKMMSRTTAKHTLEALYNGCVMLNPGLDIELWVSLAYSLMEDEQPLQNILFPPDGIMPEKSEKIITSKQKKQKKLTKAKFLNLEKYLKERVIGQDHAVEALVSALKRSQVGLNDEGRPLGVFLFSGSSGVGKTHLARELHKYLYGDDVDLVRVDCGEYQHKHDNQKLTGSPPGYVAHEDGGQFANAVRENPDTVVLLDEVEKAHPDIWNTFLRIFDEGILTDSKGRLIDFRNAVIIMTTNLGNDKVVDNLTSASVGFNTRITTSLKTTTIPSRSHIEGTVNAAIKKSFKPEFLNRIDQTIIFNYLTPEDFLTIADLELQKTDEKLSKKGIVFKYDDQVLQLLVDLGVDSVKGARGMSQVRRELIEDKIADKILHSRSIRGAIIEVTVKDSDFAIEVISPKKRAAREG